MITVVSHRGNVVGKQPHKENSPSYIEDAVALGFDVEVDVWYVQNGIYLGHDYPQYEVSVSWLKAYPLWCHAKNMEAMELMLSLGVHCFWHQTDSCTLTSRGFIWCFPEIWTENGITVCLEKPKLHIPAKKCLGVCTDHAIEWAEYRSMLQASLHDQQTA